MAANTLTRVHAEAIRSVHAAGGLSQQSIARIFGCSQVMVSRIIRGKAWNGDACLICGADAHQLKRASGRLTRGSGRRRDVRRAYIIERDGGRCHLCGVKPAPADIHLDHLVPLALGGTHDEANLRVACSTCNLSKGARARNDQLLLIG